MAEIRWERYPRAAELDAARAWLVLQRNLGLAANTIDAYGRALEEYLSFSVAKESFGNNRVQRITLPPTSGISPRGRIRAGQRWSCSIQAPGLPMRPSNNGSPPYDSFTTT